MIGSHLFQRYIRHIHRTSCRICQDEDHIVTSLTSTVDGASYEHDKNGVVRLADFVPALRCHSIEGRWLFFHHAMLHLVLFLKVCWTYDCCDLGAKLDEEQATSDKHTDQRSIY